MTFLFILIVGLCIMFLAIFTAAAAIAIGMGVSPALRWLWSIRAPIVKWFILLVLIPTAMNHSAFIQLQKFYVGMISFYWLFCVFSWITNSVKKRFGRP